MWPTRPRTPGGTSTAWVMAGVSGTVPRMSPPLTVSPARTRGVNGQRVACGSGNGLTPRSMKLPLSARRSVSGRCKPS